MEFNKEFEKIAKEMALNFARAQRISRHPGLKGDSAESIVRAFLSDYLPKNLEISTGQIYDTNKQLSNQLDIIIHDRGRTPILYLDQEKHIKLVPVECVYAVVEVKSKLDKRELFKRGSGIFENMLSVRKLTKKAFYPDGAIIRPTVNYGQEWTDWPINYFVFAFDSIMLNTLAVHINGYHKDNNLPPEKRIDCVCILNKGVLLNKTSDGKFSACPDSRSPIIPYPTPKELLLFYTLIGHFLFQTYMRNFKFKDYLDSMTF